MAYDEALADRIRRALKGRTDVEERHMFGGVAFMLRNHMCCGVVQSRMMVRLDPDTTEPLLRLPNVEPMDFTGRPMRGFLFVDGEALAGDEGLREWLDRAVAYAESIPEEPIGIEDEVIGLEPAGEGEEALARRPAAKRAPVKREARGATERVARKVVAKRAVKKAAAKRAVRRVVKRASRKTAAKRAVRRVVKRAVRKTAAKRGVRRVAKRAARKTVAKRAVRRAVRARAKKRR